MRHRMVNRVLGGSCAALLVFGVGLSSPPSASAQTAARTVTATPTPPTAAVGGSHVTMKGRAGIRAGRPTQLQLLSGSRWGVAKTARTGKRGYYSVTDPVARTGVYRVVLPAVRLHGHRLKALVSPTRTFAPASELPSGQTMATGQSLTSPNGLYRLAIQPDGTLRLTKTADPTTVLWSSKAADGAPGTSTTSHPGARLVMQYAGNLVLVDPANALLWDSGTKVAGAKLVLGDNGRLSVVNGTTVLWDSVNGTNVVTPPTGAVNNAVVRAMSWVSAVVPYSQSKYYTNQFGRYRQDCSGFVSMAWGLPSSYTTRTLPNITHVISKSALTTGDILNSYDYHVVMFDAWADAGHTRYWAYEQSPGGTKHRVISYPYFSGYRPSTFIPRRLN